MMTQWLLFAGLTLAVLAALLLPLLRRQSAAPDRLDYDLAVYRDQLAEVDRDAARGLLDDAQAASARTEIQRRILAAAGPGAGAGVAPARLESGRWLRLVAAMVILVGLPGGALFLYGMLGEPGLPAQPYAERANTTEFKVSMMVQQLAARLKEHPDPKGYAILGDTLRKLGRLREASEAYGRAVELGAEDAESLSNYGEALVDANRGAVIPDARRAFLRALKADPQDPRGRFYLGLAEAEIGQAAKALAIWRDLEGGSPADAPWLPMLRERIADLGRQAGIDPAGVAPQRP